MVVRWAAILRPSLSQYIDTGISCGISVLKISRSTNPPQPPHRPLLSQIPCSYGCPCKPTTASGVNVLAVWLPFGECHRLTWYNTKACSRPASPPWQCHVLPNQGTTLSLPSKVSNYKYTMSASTLK